MTDAISYKMLCRDQLEYFRDNTNFEITLISGGSKKDIKELVDRNVGTVYDAKLERRPSLIKDFRSLIYLTTFIYNNKFDLVIYSTPKALLLGSIATLLTRQKKSIAVIQGRAYEKFTGNKRLFYQMLDKVSLASPKNVVFVSKSLKNVYLSENLLNSKKAHVLGHGSFNGVDTRKFNKNNKTKLNYKSTFNVLIAGRVCYDKGFLDFLEILKYIKNRNIKFQLVGPIEDKKLEELLYKTISENDNVEHVPYTDDIQTYFRDADLHLFLTHREGFGNVAIEAASSGIPTFAYDDVIGVKDSVKDGVSGKKFVFQDFKSIANAIDRASIDPDFDKRYPKAREWVIENFEQQKVWNAYLEFYNSVLNKGS